MNSDLSWLSNVKLVLDFVSSGSLVYISLYMSLTYHLMKYTYINRLWNIQAPFLCKFYRIFLQCCFAVASVLLSCFLLPPKMNYIWCLDLALPPHSYMIVGFSVQSDQLKRYNTPLLNKLQVWVTTLLCLQHKQCKAS